MLTAVITQAAIKHDAHNFYLLYVYKFIHYAASTAHAVHDTQHELLLSVCAALTQ